MGQSWGAELTRPFTWAGLPVGLSEKSLSRADCDRLSENSERALDQSRTGNLEPTIQGTLHWEAAQETLGTEVPRHIYTCLLATRSDQSGAEGPLKGLCPAEGKGTNEEGLPTPWS